MVSLGIGLACTSSSTSLPPSALGAGIASGPLGAGMAGPGTVQAAPAGQQPSVGTHLRIGSSCVRTLTIRTFCLQCLHLPQPSLSWQQPVSQPPPQSLQ